MGGSVLVPHDQLVNISAVAWYHINITTTSIIIAS